MANSIGLIGVRWESDGVRWSPIGVRRSPMGVRWESDGVLWSPMGVRRSPMESDRTKGGRVKYWIFFPQRKLFTTA